MQTSLKTVTEKNNNDRVRGSADTASAIAATARANGRRTAPSEQRDTGGCATAPGAARRQRVAGEMVFRVLCARRYSGVNQRCGVRDALRDVDAEEQLDAGAQPVAIRRPGVGERDAALAVLAEVYAFDHARLQLCVVAERHEPLE